VPLDWETIAQAARRDFDPSSPDTTLLRKYYEDILETSLIPFSAPLPSSVPVAHYWMLGPFGAVEVRPQHIFGTIAVQVDLATYKVYDITYGGLLKAVPRGAGNFGAAYFQLFTPDSISIRSAPADFIRDSAHPVIHGSVGSQSFRVTFDSTLSDRTMPPVKGSLARLGDWARAFEISRTGQLYLMVSWEKVECGESTYLYEIVSGKPSYVTIEMGNCGE
jgi:hypothetical protein